MVGEDGAMEIEVPRDRGGSFKPLLIAKGQKRFEGFDEICPSDEAATKLIYLALRNITKSWKNPPLTWRMAANQFAIQFGERFNK